MERPRNYIHSTNNDSSQSSLTTRVFTYLKSNPHSLRYIPREHLTDIFTRNDNIRLFLVIAPAGYGKSTTVHLALEEAEKTSPNLKHVWMTMDGDHLKADEFIRNILNATRQIFPSFGQALDHTIHP